MDSDMLKRHLALADEHIATGHKNLARQRTVIAELERHGHDTSEAIATLDLFEEVQAQHIADRARILSELGL